MALKKILCYVKVWLSDDKPETVDAGELKRCQQLSPDDSQMEVDFGKAPEKTKCSLEDVANYPGTDAFKEIESKSELLSLQVITQVCSATRDARKFA